MKKMLDKSTTITTESKEEKIQKVLRNIHVCKRCCVRIISGQYWEHSVVGTEVTIKKGSHCCACLGILEGFTLNSIAKETVEKLEASNYDSPTFQIGIAVPQCLILRQSSLVTHLIDNGHSICKDFPTVKTVAKFYLTKLVNKLSGKKLDTQSELFIKLDFNFPADAKEISKLDPLLHHSRKRHSSGKAIINQYKSEAIQKVVKGFSDFNVKKYTPCPPHALAEACEFAVNIYHNSIFIGGRYNKYSRTLSQTPWFVEGKRRGETSTLELIGNKLKEFTHGGDIRFQTAGREDADVRMLGKGRPFAVEITDPKVTVITSEQMAKLQTDINASTDMISIHDLQKVKKAGLQLMKKGEEEKVKTYRAKLWCGELISDEIIKTLNLMKDIELHQKTPVRVLHRRPIATRLRKVHEIDMKRSDEDEHYQLNLKTQAGTYIKEFVHGDMGRTDPSLRTILDVPIDIVELDVMAIDLKWPPESEEELEKRVVGESKDVGQSKDVELKAEE